MTRKQYRALQDERDRLEQAHKHASDGLTLRDWQEPMSPGAKAANKLYHKLQRLEERLEEFESHDAEFEEDWTLVRPTSPEAA